MGTHHSHEDNMLDRGLQFDMSQLMSRRNALKMLAGGAGAMFLAGCGVKNAGTIATTTTTTSVTGSAGGSTTNEVIPTETAGPYPGDGSNGPDVLVESGIVRNDIRSSFGTSTTTAEGVPLTINLKILDSNNENKAFAGAAVYLWHCNRDGKYSMYSSGVSNENYLRGVQVADAGGNLSFTSIFPAAYDGRWPHIHFEVYENVQTAVSSGQIRKTSQMALPEDICEAVYATSGYSASIRNLARTSLATDNVFRDDSAAHQLATVTGSVTDGYAASLNVVV